MSSFFFLPTGPVLIILEKGSIHESLRLRYFFKNPRISLAWFHSSKTHRFHLSILVSSSFKWRLGLRRRYFPEIHCTLSEISNRYHHWASSELFYPVISGSRNAYVSGKKIIGFLEQKCDRKLSGSWYPDVRVHFYGTSRINFPSGALMVRERSASVPSRHSELRGS